MIERKSLKRVRQKRATANRKRFTEGNVLKLPARGKQYLAWDKGTDAARGLAILVSPTGTKSYRCVFYYPGSPKPHYMHIGRVGETTLDEARQACRDARAKARRGEDPRADAATKSDSFKAAVEDYIKHEQIGREGNTSALDTQKVILNNCKDWHARPVATLRYGEIEKLLWLLRDGDPAKELKPRPYLANRLYSHLRDFFGWCSRPNGPIKTFPMASMKKPFEKAKRRERAWFKGAAADDAVKALWRAANEIGGHEGRFLKLLVLTGKRPGQTPDAPGLAPMRWEQIEPDWFWDAPASRSKNKRLHGVPLPELAQRNLSPRQASGKVFGDLDQQKSNFDRLIARVRKLTGMDDFILHGVRHLVETKTAELRIAPHIRDLLFDHAQRRGAGAGYDHHEYKDEMRAALETWAAHVEGLVRPEGARLLR